MHYIEANYKSPQWHKWQEWQLIRKPLSFALTYDFPFPLSFLSFLSHTHLKRSQILSLVFRHRLCLNTFMDILVIHWIALKRQLIVVNKSRDWSVCLSMYIYVRQGGGSCPGVTCEWLCLGRPQGSTFVHLDAITGTWDYMCCLD